MRGAAWLLLFLAAACEDVVTIEYGADEGVLPMTYREVISGLPDTFERAEWPDGTIVVESSGEPVTIVVDTGADGGRDVTISKEITLVESWNSVYYRDLFGADRIGAIRGVDLELNDLIVKGLDLATCLPPDLRAGGTLLRLGQRAPVSAQVLLELRSRLMAGEEIRVPVSLTFHLRPDELALLPPRQLDLTIEVQPTLFINLIGAL
jgi:hypothetical protein